MPRYDNSLETRIPHYFDVENPRTNLNEIFVGDLMGTSIFRSDDTAWSAEVVAVTKEGFELDNGKFYSRTDGLK